MSASGGAFAVGFRELHLWSVRSFISVGWHWPVAVIKSLSTALLRKQIEITTTADANEALQLLTIHFDGSVEPRESGSVEEFKGKLYLAEPGDVIYSKIDVRNGAIGLVPTDMLRCAVSSEYPVYEVRSDVALGEYIKLVFRTSHFRQVINGMISGASGRKRVQPEQIESVDVPLPPLETQRAIVARWQAAQAAADAAEEQVKQMEGDLMRGVRETMGRNYGPEAKSRKAFRVSWATLDRWGVEMTRKAQRPSVPPKYPMTVIGEVCKISSGGTPSRKNPTYFGGEIPWVKTTEVRGEIIYGTEETLSRSGLENSSARLYPSGSLLVAMYGQGATRGRTAKLGIDAATNQACAVLTEITPEVEVDFLWYYLMSEYDSLRDLASGNNQPNLNAAMIASYPLPFPLLDVQRAIVKRVQAGRAEIARLRAEAEHVRRAARAEVEALILGTATHPN